MFCCDETDSLDLALFSAALCKREEFLRVLNLRSVDVVSVKVKLDRKVLQLVKICSSCIHYILESDQEAHSRSQFHMLQTRVQFWTTHTDGLSLT